MKKTLLFLMLSAVCSQALDTPIITGLSSSDGKTMELRWLAGNEEDIQAFIVIRTSGVYMEAYTLSPCNLTKVNNDFVWFDKEVTPEISYTYKIRNIGVSEDSEWSNQMTYGWHSPVKRAAVTVVTNAQIIPLESKTPVSQPFVAAWATNIVIAPGAEKIFISPGLRKDP